MTENKAVRNLFDSLNNMGFDMKDFCKEASNEHRYLQEQFTILCLKWLETCASDDYWYDGRNEYSHRVGKEVIRDLIEKNLW